MSATGIIRVEEVMEAEFLLVDGLSTVAEVLAMMRPRLAQLVIVDKRSKEDEYGIVLASDIAKHVLARNRSPERVNIYEIMSKPVLFVRPGMDIRYCARMFDRFGISYAAVISHGKIVGIVTYGDLVLKGLGANI